MLLSLFPNPFSMVHMQKMKVFCISLFSRKEGGREGRKEGVKEGWTDGWTHSLFGILFWEGRMGLSF